MKNISIKAVAAQVIEAAGQGGGSDEIARIAAKGWPGAVEVARIPAKHLEDHDDCLAAAIEQVAGELESWELSAAWDDDRARDYVVVTADSKALRAAIQAAAAEALA